MAKIVTPNKKNSGVSSFSAGSGGKLKQASLMSFFTKAKKPPTPSKVQANDIAPSKNEIKDKNNNGSDGNGDLTVISDEEGESESESTVFHSVLEDNHHEKQINTSITTAANTSTPIINKTESNVSVIKKNPESAKANEEAMRGKVVPSSPISANADKTENNGDGRTRKRITYSELSDGEEGEDDEDDWDVSFSGKKKNQAVNKKRKVIVDDDSEDEFIPDAKEEENDDDDDDFIVENVKDELEGKDIVDLDDDDDDEFLALAEKKSKDKKTKSRSKSPASKAEDDNNQFATPTKLTSQFTASSKYTPKSTSAKPTPSKSQIKSQSSTPTLTKSQKFTKENEERYQWLVNIKDAQQRLTSDPEYDPRTLYIPSSAWSKFTAFEKQFWEIKSKMWDCIVFFKKGKFYELYEKDAMVAHSEFDLKIAGGGRANMQLAGVPEMSFTYWATAFIGRGYKVAKVDQVETGLAKEIREESGKSPAGKKEVIRRELSCVLTAGTLTEENMLSDDMATYCLSVKESPHPSDLNGKVFGVSFIDTATGSIKVTQFEDDAECTKFETLMSQIRPREVVYAKGNLSSLSLRVLKFNCQNGAIFNVLKDEVEFYDADVAFEQLCHGQYFEAENLDDLSHWPDALRCLHENDQSTGLSSFGGLLWYLRSLKLDKSLISLGNITNYTTLKPTTNLVLDGQTLQNLEIFANSFDGTDRGTLFKLINRATTAFGKRMLRTWVVHPLMQRADIEARLDSVEQIMDDGELRDVLERKLMRLPDLERLISRIHAKALKLKDFTRVIEGFEEIRALVRELKAVEPLRGVLKKLVYSIPQEFESALDKWSDAFDRVVAKNDDMLILNAGVEADYDESKAQITELESELQTLLRSYRKQFKTQLIEYKDSGKELYTIELSSSIKVPSSWKLMGSNKKTKRYWSPEVESLSKKYARAKELHSILESSLKIRMLSRFDADYQTWTSVISTIGKVDCLLSLAKTSLSLGYPSCRPEFVDSETGVLDFKELRHPCFNLGVSSAKEFIPNDIQLGCTSGASQSPNIGLLTGANAAGKSTILRMTCIAVILAQIGCYVPSQSARLTPIDRIMTRLGANDNIMQGKSTFYVELSETKKILQHATPKSLLVIDELGRGGSSSDGFAIAEAVLHHLATHVQSLGFFATHYGALYDSFKAHPKVTPLRMAILVNEEDKTITFLYKLESGQSPGSFGMNVARMCGIPLSIVEASEAAAESFEFTSKLKAGERQSLRVQEVCLGLQSDFVKLVKDGLQGCGEGVLVYDEGVKLRALENLYGMIDGLYDD